MKKVLLIIGLLLTVVLVNSYNYPSTWSGNRNWAYENKTLEIMYDSKKRPHKIVIYSKFKEGMTAVDLDALAKGGKAWDAEKKIIVNLKHKCEFKPFDKVLGRNEKDDVWEADLFSHYRKESQYPFRCIGCSRKYCIPYEGNEHLLGIRNNPE